MELVTNGQDGKFRPRVKVQMDLEMSTSNEFFLVTYDPTTGAHKSYHNCDAVTMGMAVRIAAIKFKEMYDNLTPAQRKEVDSIFHAEVPQE